MNCKNCGAILNEGEKFCGQCGTAIEVGNTSNQQSNVTEWQQGSTTGDYTNATQWQQGTVQYQPPQQNQYNQNYQQNQQYQQYSANNQQQFTAPKQSKGKDSKIAIIMIILTIIIPVVLVFLLIGGVITIILTAGNSGLIAKAENARQELYSNYNSMYEENQTIDNPPRLLTDAESTVNLGVYTLTLPSTVEGKGNSLRSLITLNSKDHSWMGQITTKTIAYDTLKEQKELASAVLSKMIDEENATSSELKVENVGGVEYLISEILSSEGKGLLGYTKLNSYTTAIVVIYNTDGTSSRTPLTDVSKIIKSAK